MQNRRKGLFLAVLLVVGLQSAQLRANGLYTDRRLYQPFANSPLQAPLQVQQRLAGHCARQSQVSIRENAWQCQVNDQTFDPCFQNPYQDPSTLICPLSPWSEYATVISIHQRLIPTRSADQLDISKALPWALELDDGTRCLRKAASQRGTHSYYCQAQQFITGKIFRCKAKWQVFKKSDQQIDTSQVIRAWF